MTAVMAPDPAEGPIRGPDPAIPSPVITWGGVAVPGVATAKRSRRKVWIVSGVVILILLVIATAGTVYFLSPPDLTLSTHTANVGDAVTITATHLPAYQQADIVLLPNAYTFPVYADTLGRATRQIDVPADIEPGDHMVQVCWNDSCPLSTTLHVEGVTPASARRLPLRAGRRASLAGA